MLLVFGVEIVADRGHLAALDVDLRFEATRRETANDDGAETTTMSGAGSGRDGEGRSSWVAKAADSVARGEQRRGRPPG